MGYNKFITTNNQVLLDLSSDTVAPDKLLSGATAHDKSGNLITGSYSSGGNATVETCTVTITITRSSGMITCHTDSAPEQDFGSIIGRISVTKTITAMKNTSFVLQVNAGTITNHVTTGEIQFLTMGRTTGGDAPVYHISGDGTIEISLL